MCAVVGVRAWCVTDICHHVQNKVGSEDKDCVETLCVEMPGCPRDRIKALPVGTRGIRHDSCRTRCRRHDSCRAHTRCNMTAVSAILARSTLPCADAPRVPQPGVTALRGAHVCGLTRTTDRAAFHRVRRRLRLRTTLPRGRRGRARRPRACSATRSSSCRSLGVSGTAQE